jgi:hypothetical protein
MIIPEKYYKELKKVELTEADINIIIEALNSSQHNLFEYLNYDKIIKKLKGKKINGRRKERKDENKNM